MEDSHDLPLGLYVVGHGNGTEVFQGHDEIRVPERSLWHRWGRAPWEAAQLEGHCNRLRRHFGGHREEGRGACKQPSGALETKPLKFLPVGS